MEAAGSDRDVCGTRGDGAAHHSPMESAARMQCHVQCRSRAYQKWQVFIREAEHVGDTIGEREPSLGGQLLTSRA